ncbi:MAG: hypothetical protein KBC74_03805 [Candidatus Pacebacteria bacterium]|nr:hypothetical protein [Candidatus Paceibacterota bacterium]MBP9832613.1 hypothetical protein [Candidatus Paceibacterota bacterium]
MDKKLVILISIAVVAVTIFVGLVWYGGQKTLPITEIPLDSPILGDGTQFHTYGAVTIRLGEQIVFEGLSVKVISLEEDSRCPTGVACIQAGTVRVKVEIVSGLGTSTPIISLGKSITTEAEVITLTATTPYPARDMSITKDEYQFTFTVTKRPTSGCFIGGCSSQICSDQPDVVSSCEYRSEYACYQKAACERQVSGKCGWTKTTELESCLLNPPAL